MTKADNKNNKPDEQMGRALRIFSTIMIVLGMLAGFVWILCRGVYKVRWFLTVAAFIYLQTTKMGF